MSAKACRASHSRHGTIINSSFRPARGLANCHLQTILPTFISGEALPQVRHEHFELEDGDFIQLTWNRPSPNSSAQVWQGTLLILHGLEGSWRSPYARSLLAEAHRQGLRACVVHFRGCGDRLNRLDRGYHSGDTQDLRNTITEVRERFPTEPIYVAGYSLGGNVLLKLLGEDGTHCPIHAAVAVSVPMLLGVASVRLNIGFSRFYQWWFLRTLRTKMRKKFANRVDPPICLESVLGARCMSAFDDSATAPLHGFESAEHYYEDSSSRQYLRKIARPTLIIQARDDPFTTDEALPPATELATSVTLELTERGGHVGYIAPRDLGGCTWLTRRIIARFKAFQT